jgi:hypothetical protein
MTMVLSTPKAVTNTLTGWPHFDQNAIDAVLAVLKSGKVNYWTGDEGKVKGHESDTLGLLDRKNYPLWNNWLMLAAVLLLLSTEWTLRRRMALS